MELTLREIQLMALEIFKEVKSICDKHKIQYFVDSGTLLGALRHKGFIPWDDDIDIIFWRVDFERFVSVAKKELPSRYKLVLPGERDVFYDFIGKIINPAVSICPDTNETEYYGNYTNKPAVDLLVLDNASSNHIKQSCKIIVMKIIYGMAMAYRFSIDYKKYDIIERITIFLLSSLGKFFSYKTLYDWYQAVIQIDNNQISPICFGGLSTPPYLDRRIPSRCYQFGVSIQFENLEVYAPIGYDEVLTITYGDYHIPPEVEKRVPKHAIL